MFIRVYYELNPDFILKIFKKTVDKTVFCGTIIKHPGVAQVVACLNGVQEAVSSSLATRTIIVTETNVFVTIIFLWCLVIFFTLCYISKELYLKNGTDVKATHTNSEVSKSDVSCDFEQLNFEFTEQNV